MKEKVSSFHVARKSAAGVDEFAGLCIGVIADGVVNLQEVNFLVAWLESRDYLLQDPIVAKVYSVLIQGRDEFSSDNELRILSVLVDYTGAPMADDVERRASSLPLTNPRPSVVFEGQYYCFTGVFDSGTRAACMAMTEELGGICGKDVSNKTSYLVVGSNVSPDWKHSNYGRKILQAVERIESKGQALSIISEDHWLSAVEVLRK